MLKMMMKLYLNKLEDKQENIQDKNQLDKIKKKRNLLSKLNQILL